MRLLQGNEQVGHVGGVHAADGQRQHVAGSLQLGAQPFVHGALCPEQVGGRGMLTW